MKRPIAWMAFFTICGIYMRLGISGGICLVSFLFSVIAISRYMIKNKNWKYVLLLLFIALGFWRAEGSVLGNISPLSGIVRGTGVVQTAGKTDAGNQKLTLYCDLEDEEGRISKNTKVYAIWTGEGSLTAGDRTSFVGEIMPFNRQTVPGGYDEALYLKTRGIDYKIYPERMTYEGEDDSFSSKLARGRTAIHKVTERLLPPEESGILKALLTGDKDDIPQEAYQLYTEAGVVHVLCISGLHMSCLALYISFFMEKILRQSRRFSAGVTILAVMGFLVFTGFTPSAVRAALMISVVMLGRIIFCSHDRLNEIAIAAMVLLLIEPLYLFHIGFQLSFITVLGLSIAADHIRIVRKKSRTWKDWLREGILMSLYATLFSAPVVAYHFHSVSFVGILANLVIIPLSGLLLGLGILSMLLGLFCIPMGVFVAGSVYGILQIFHLTCTLLLKLPFAYVLTGRPASMTIFLLYLLLLFWMKYGGEKKSWIGASVLSLSIFLSVFQNSLFAKETTVAFLDVGQGDCAVISTYDDRHYLIDGGGQYGKEVGENTGKYTVLPYLEYLGVDRLSGAFLSHPDRDHMIGLLEVLEEVPTEGLYVSDYSFGETRETLLLKETVEKYRIPLYTVTMGENAAGFTCLYPSGEIVGKGDNSGSLVLKYNYGETDILFTGDISATDERLVLASGVDVSADILKVSHHGSKNSSYQAFIQAVAPKTAIISCGKENIYGHPHEDVLDRLERAEVYRTDQNGSVLCRIRQDGTYTIETMTERKPFYESVKERMGKK